VNQKLTHTKNKMTEIKFFIFRGNEWLVSVPCSRFTPENQDVSFRRLIIFVFVCGQRFTPDVKTVSLCLLISWGVAPHPSQGSSTLNNPVFN
jgi:hypothetical protein